MSTCIRGSPSPSTIVTITTMQQGAGVEVLTVCQEQEKGAVQTGQLPAGHSPREAGRALQSLRTIRILNRNWFLEPAVYIFFSYRKCTLPHSKDLIRPNSLVETKHVPIDTLDRSIKNCIQNFLMLIFVFQ